MGLAADGANSPRGNPERPAGSPSSEEFMRANFVMSGVAEGMRRNLLMSIALVLTTAVSLSFVAAAILTGIEIHRFSDEYKGLLSVQVYLCDANKVAPCKEAITPADRTALEQRLRTDPQITQ